MSKEIPNGRDMQAFWRARASALHEARRRDALGDAFEAHRDGVTIGAARLVDRCEICCAIRVTCHRRRAGEFTCDSCNRLKHYGRLPKTIHAGMYEISRIRELLGVKQLDFAIHAGMSQSVLCRIESRGTMRTINAIRIAQVIETLDPQMHHPFKYLLVVVADIAPHLL